MSRSFRPTLRAAWRRARLATERLESRALPTGTGYLPPSQFWFEPDAASAAARLTTADPLTTAVAYLNAHADKLGLTPADLADPIVTSQYTDTDSSTTHIYLRQRYHGLEVANADLNVSVLANGAVFSVGGGFVAGLADRPDRLVQVMDPANAVRAAAAAAGVTAASGLNAKPVYGPTRSFTFTDPAISTDDIPAQLHYVATADGGAALAWQTVLHLPGGQHWYDISVDAGSGSLLFMNDWVDNDSYSVLPPPNESPQDGGFAVVTSPANANASPFGWQDTNGVAGPEFTDTRGNNVDAHLDRDADNLPDASPPRPAGGANLDFSGYAFDPTQAPAALVNENAAVVNLFYMNNVLHDVHYQYGFTEAAGNFQVNNYGKGGTGADAVQADAQDGSGTDNANFGTPADGSSGRMQMYEWDFNSPRRDSDLDNSVIIHEYGHGVSNRLTGGPANSSALSAIQSGGMGEGWSDFYALMLLQRPTDTQNGSYGIGTYVLGQPNTGVGIRRFPYSFNMATNPLTYDAYGSSGTTSYGVTRSTEVHNTGEIWTSTLWDMNWLLIQKYGYDPNLYSGWSASPGAGHAGNKFALKLVMDALKLQPANPSFVQARNAIIAADNALDGGADLYEIWTAFARRGLGTGAVNASSGDTTVAADTTMPMLVSGVSPATGNVVTTNPASYVVNVTAPITPGTLQAADLTVNGQPATSVSYTAGSTSATFTFSTDPVAGEGAQTMQITSGAFTRASDGSNIAAYSSTFYVDATPLLVTTTAPSNGAAVVPPFTQLDVNLNEAVAPGSVSTGDLWVSAGSVTAVSLLNGNQTARFTLSNITTESTVSAAIAPGAFTDPTGSPLAAGYSATFAVDYATRAFPTPLTAVNPLGSQVYQGSIAGLINPLSSGTDTDDFTLQLNAGETVALQVTPDTTLQPRIQLLSPSAAVLADVSAAAAGQLAAASAVLLSTPGTYTFRVQGVSGSTGRYAVQATLNADTERESLGGATNNTPTTAQSLTPATTTVTTTPATATRAAVLGSTDPNPGYNATSVPYSFEDISASGTTILASLDDSNTSVNMPFVFNFLGTNYTTVYVATNGLMTFGAGNSEYTNADLSTDPAQPAIAVYWDDLFTTANGVKVQVLGSAPNRRLDVEWLNVRYYAGTATTLQFEAILFEGSNQIRFNYAQLSALTTGHDEGASATVGVGNGAGIATLLAFNNGPNSYVGSGKSISLVPAAAPPDWYSFNVAAGQTVSLAALASGSSALNVQLYASDGTTLLATGTTGATNLTTAIQNFAVPSAGTYYAAVNATGVVPYELTVLTNAAFDAESNNTAAAAQLLGGSHGALGQVAPGNDDWYSITLGAIQSALNLATATPSDGGGQFANTLDPAIQLYDATGATLIASGTPLADGRNESISATGLTGGATYTIRISAAGATSGEYFLGAAAGGAAPPMVGSVTINGGAVQRSRVTSVAVSFDQHVTISGPAAAAFGLKRQSDGALPALTATVDDSGATTVVALTFSGTTAVDAGSLADGRYILTVLASKVSGPGGALDGDSNGTGGDDYALTGTPANGLFRLFGDGDGSGTVDVLDFGQFRLAFGTPDNTFDFDNGGGVDVLDFGQFRQRFGTGV